MKALFVGLLLMVPLHLFCYPLESSNEDAYWIEISWNIFFHPARHGVSPSGTGLEVNVIFENGIGFGIGAGFDEWINFTVNGLYFPRLIESDLILFPVKGKLGINYLFKEYVWSLSLSTGIRALVFLSEDELYRRVYLETDLLGSLYFFFNRFDRQWFRISPEINLGMIGDTYADAGGANEY